MAAKHSIVLVLAALTAPYLYDRYLTLSALLSNGPGRIQSVNNFQDYEIKFKDRLRNCEDVLVD